MPAHVILVRHGQSLWNQEGRFTGWVDVDLTPKGCAQAQAAGASLKAYGMPIHHAYTSVLKRAIRTLWIMLDTLDAMAVPITSSWRLNERHYGDLQGKKKTEIRARYGEAQLHAWRRSYDTAPPPRKAVNTNPYPPSAYFCPPEPATESLKDTLLRLMPLLDQYLPQHITQEENVLFCAHGNSLRAFVKYLTNMPDTEIGALEMMHTQPMIFQYGTEGWQHLISLTPA